jgi:hypothetical protein
MTYECVVRARLVLAENRVKALPVDNSSESLQAAMWRRILYYIETYGAMVSGIHLEFLLCTYSNNENIQKS